MSGKRAKQMRRLTYGDQSTKPVPLDGNYQQRGNGEVVSPAIRRDFKDSKRRWKNQRGRCFYCDKPVPRHQLVHPRCEADEIEYKKNMSEGRQCGTGPLVEPEGQSNG